MSIRLEIVEGPGAGRQIELTGPIVLGRDASADVTLDDTQVSRRHARVTPEGGAATVEDLESRNGTYVNGNEIHAPAPIDPGDELVIGTTVLQLVGEAVAASETAIRPVPAAFASGPPPLAIPARRPDFTERLIDSPDAPSAGVPELEKLRDRRVRAQAQLAPLAVFVVAAFVIVIYLATK